MRASGSVGVNSSQLLNRHDMSVLLESWNYRRRNGLLVMVVQYMCQTVSEIREMQLTFHRTS